MREKPPNPLSIPRPAISSFGGVLMVAGIDWRTDYGDLVSLVALSTAL